MEYSVQPNKLLDIYSYKNQEQSHPTPSTHTCTRKSLILQFSLVVISIKYSVKTFFYFQDYQHLQSVMKGKLSQQYSSDNISSISKESNAWNNFFIQVEINLNENIQYMIYHTVEICKFLNFLFEIYLNLAGNTNLCSALCQKKVMQIDFITIKAFVQTAN